MLRLDGSVATGTGCKVRCWGCTSPPGVCYLLAKLDGIRRLLLVATTFSRHDWCVNSLTHWLHGANAPLYAAMPYAVVALELLLSVLQRGVASLAHEQ